MGTEAQTLSREALKWENVDVFRKLPEGQCGWR